MKGKSTFLSNDSTFVSPSTCFHLTSHILHVTHVLSFCLSLSSLYPLSVSFFFSTDNRQSSHAVHLLRLWRRPSESLSLSAQISLWSFSIFLQPAYPSFLSFVIVYSYECHSLHCCLAGLQSFSSQLDLVTSCHFSFSSMYVFNFCYDLKTASFASSFSTSFQHFYPKPALHLFLLSIFFSPSLPPLTVLPCLSQDTAEYVAYVAKDPVNQRGEQKQQNDTFAQAASDKNRHFKTKPY